MLCLHVLLRIKIPVAMTSPKDKIEKGRIKYLKDKGIASILGHEIALKPSENCSDKI
jgi:hypothetical protein